MVTAPTFYNLKDQGIYSAGDFFIPQEKYRAAPYTVKKPNNPDEVPAGIPTVYQPRGSADGFDPYNTNMSTIRQDYDPFPSRQAGEIYSKTFNPQSTFDPNLTRAQNTANLIRTYESGIGPGVMRLGNTVFDASKFSPGQRASLLKSADNFIDDARMQYATEGQYVDPYDPNYSSITEAQKFMDNYPEYYGVPSGVPEPGIPGAIKSYLQNSLLGKAANFVGGLMPINQRAIMENEARGAGIFTDDIGRIVTDDYNTAGGIMAGYNLNALTKEGSTAVSDRRNTVMNTLENKYGLTKSAVDALRKDPSYTGPAKVLLDRLDLFDEFEDNISTINTRKKLITKMRADKKAADKKKKEDDAAAAAAAAAQAAAKRERKFAAEGRSDPNDPSRQGASGRRPGSGGTAIARDDQGDRGAGQTGGYGYDSGGREGFGYGLADGGRVYYMDGGLADLLEIYD